MASLFDLPDDCLMNILARLHVHSRYCLGGTSRSLGAGARFESYVVLHRRCTIPLISRQCAHLSRRPTRLWEKFFIILSLESPIPAAPKAVPMDPDYLALLKMVCKGSLCPAGCGSKLTPTSCKMPCMTDKVIQTLHVLPVSAGLTGC